MTARLTLLLALFALAACNSVGAIAPPEADFSADVADMMAANGCAASERDIIGFALAADHSEADAQAAIMALRDDGLLSVRADGRYDLTGYGDCV